MGTCDGPGVPVSPATGANEDASYWETAPPGPKPGLLGELLGLEDEPDPAGKERDDAPGVIPVPSDPLRLEALRLAVQYEGTGDLSGALPAAEGFYRFLCGVAPARNAEVERDAVVAFLRRMAIHEPPAQRDAIMKASDAIRKGEHRGA